MKSCAHLLRRPDGSCGASRRHLAALERPDVIGGLLAAPCPSLHTFWLHYVSVPDLESASARAVGAGCSHRSDTPSAFFTRLNDPHGASIGLRRSSHGDPAPTDRTAPGSFGWEQLNTPGAAASLALYTQLFAWSRAVFEEMSVFSHADQQVASLMQGPVDMPAHWPGWARSESCKIRLAP